jgi:hypothetical protein
MKKARSKGAASNMGDEVSWRSAPRTHANSVLVFCSAHPSHLPTLVKIQKKVIRTLQLPVGSVHAEEILDARIDPSFSEETLFRWNCSSLFTLLRLHARTCSAAVQSPLL